TFAKSRGKTLFRWNIQEEQVTDPMTGEVTTKYVYNEVGIDGKVAKAKILEAMRLAELEQGSDGDAALQYEDATTRIAEIADMTYAELDTYINDNVTDLVSAKTFLKRLARVVLAILKRFNW
ncbi:MAG: hypothetical protein H8E40_14395, partial [Chloroflexi bacterium]|nr:hypothetical protein [Chloroflexota bacterium]